MRPRPANAVSAGAALDTSVHSTTQWSSYHGKNLLQIMLLAATPLCPVLTMVQQFVDYLRPVI